MTRFTLACGALCVLACALPTRAETISDNFEDGVIDAGLWTVGGSNQVGFGGIGSWSVQEVTASDGYLDARIQGPETGNSYGQEVWIRTNYDYNDGSTHVINFRWGAQVNAYHIDGFNISVTNGSNPTSYHDYSNPSGMWELDNADNTRLYSVIDDDGVPPWTGQQNLAPIDWSIAIDATGRTATLYQGPNLTGSALPTKALDPGSPWYLRFYQLDATSSGYPGTDNHLFLYSYSSVVPEPSSLGLLAVAALGLLRCRRAGL